MISPTPLCFENFDGLLSAGMTVYTVFHWSIITKEVLDAS